MGDFAVVKRIVLEVCLLHPAQQGRGTAGGDPGRAAGT
jgi:hypothetical protein